MPLDEYRAKRDFAATPEPASGTSSAEGALRFVVQEHHARTRHWDFRLELDGVLVSWAVPKGPSLDPHNKRLAVHVEDHPLDYGSFEGTIPAGEYGAGTVAIWDSGTWQPLGDPHSGLEKGDFKFTLSGSKLRGLWVLVRMQPRTGEKRENWLLIKEQDEFAESPTPEGQIGGAKGGGFSAQSGSAPTANGPASTPSDPSDLPFSALAHTPAVATSNPTPHSGPYTEAPATASADALRAATAPPRPAAPAKPSAAPFPSSIDIELATLVDEPPEGDDWVAEVKYDGYRVVLALDGGGARAFTRSHADWSDRFAPLVEAARELPAASAIIDGEAVVYDERGVSRFELLQRALGEHPERVAFAAFDLLHLNGHDLRELPLTSRKELLAELLAEPPDGSPLRYASHVVGQTREFYRQACVSDLEGIVCKRAGSRYVAGRGREWVKVKCRQTAEFVVGGFTEGTGSREQLGAVLVGTYDDSGRLVYAGRVGSGFDNEGVASMRARLGALEQQDSPFDPPPHVAGHIVHWARPEIVIQAAFREWTSDGVLRQPVYLGIREDKQARDVAREGSAPSDIATSSDAGAAGDPAATLGIHITNPGKRLFPESAFTKLDLATYYASVAPLMLAEITERPLTLVRCPAGRGRDCFYQRHPDAGLPKQVRRLPHTLKGEAVELLYVDSVEGLIALAQMAVGEIHTWMSRSDAPTRPDRICFDLDPGPEVDWHQIRAAALIVRDECSERGLSPFLKSTGSKGLHVIVPIEPVWEFTRIRSLAKALVDRLVERHPDVLVGKMAKSARTGRVFVDYLRNAEGASAVAPYSTRMNAGPSCAVPLAWNELAEDLDIRSFTPDKVLQRITEGTDPWRTIEDAAVGVKVLRKAEVSLGE